MNIKSDQKILESMSNTDLFRLASRYYSAICDIEDELAKRKFLNEYDEPRTTA